MKDEAHNQYTLRLSFAEPDDHQPGERVFDVSVGDQKLLEGFDPVKEAGGRNRMLVKEFRGIKTDNELQLTFAATAGKPLICGLELVAE
jgi:hypothetical protein